MIFESTTPIAVDFVHASISHGAPASAFKQGVTW